MQQLPLSFDLDEDGLRSYLEKASDKTVSLFITDNSYSLLTLTGGESSVKLRLHRIFLSAGYEVLAEIADFIINSRIRTPLIRIFINQNTHQIKKKSPVNAKLRHPGKYHNLLDIFNAINREYFNESINASITWGSRGPKLRAKRRTLGSYGYNSNVIRINPILDSRRVPLYYLEFIIYHEMLHADLGIDTVSGRNSFHSREFKKRERLFKHYERALNHEKRN